MSGVASSMAGGAAPAGSASQPLPWIGRARKASNASGASTVGSPGGAALLGGLEDHAPKLLSVAVAEARGYSSCARGFERNDRADAELHRFFRHPGEPLAISRGHRERQLRLDRLPLGRLDLDHPVGADPHQPPGSGQS